MSLQRRFTVAGLTLGLFFTFSDSSFAQQTQPEGQGVETPQQQTERLGKRRGRKAAHRAGHMMRIFRELELTDAQREQARSIIERYAASTKPQREELRQLRQQRAQGALSTDAEARAQSLRAEIRQTHESLRAELLAVLTPEQRAKFDQIKQEFKSRREAMRGRRWGTQDNDQ